MSECLDNIAKEIEKISDPQEKAKKKAFVSATEAEFNVFLERTKNMSIPEKAEAGRKFFEDYRYAASESAIFAANNERVGLAHDAYLKNPGLNGSVDAAEKMIQSLQGLYLGKKSEYINRLGSFLNSKDLIDRIRLANPEMRKMVSMEAFELQKGREGGISKNKEALDIAVALKKINDFILQDMRNRGIPVKYGDTFFGGSVFHDEIRIGLVDMKTWRDITEPLLDPEATFGANNMKDEAFKKAWFQKHYDDITNNKIIDPNAKPQDAAMAKRMLRQKAFIFLDGEKAHTYKVEFGDDNLFGSQLRYIDRVSKNLAGYELLGSDADFGFNSFIEKARTAFKKEASDIGSNKVKLDKIHKEALVKFKDDPAGAKAFIASERKILNAKTNSDIVEKAAKKYPSDLPKQKEYQTKLKEKLKDQITSDSKHLNQFEKQLKNSYDSIMHPEPIWGTTPIAKTGKTVSSMANLSFLGFTALQGFATDNIYSSGNITAYYGGNIIANYTKLMQHQLTWHSKAEKQAIMAAIGQALDVVGEDSMNTILARSGKPGMMNKTAGWIMKMTGAEAQYMGSHVKSAVYHQLQLGFLSKYEFKDLSHETRGLMGIAGISEELWNDVIRKSLVEIKGATYLNINGLEGLDLTPGRKVQASTAIVRLFRHTVNEGIPGGKAKQRAQLKVTDPNSPSGTFALLFNQFKNFANSHYSIMSHIRNYDPQKLAIKIMDKKIGSPSALRTSGQMMVGLGIAAGVAKAAHDLALGKEPEEITPGKFMEHMAKSNAPLVADMLLGLYYSSKFDKGIPSAFAPPVVSMLNDGIKLMKGIDDSDKFAGQAADFILNRAPIINSFWSKKGADFLFGDAIRDHFDPDFQERAMEKLHKQRGLFNEERTQAWTIGNAWK